MRFSIAQLLCLMVLAALFASVMAAMRTVAMIESPVENLVLSPAGTRLLLRHETGWVGTLDVGSRSYRRMAFHWSALLAAPQNETGTLVYPGAWLDLAPKFANDRETITHTTESFTNLNSGAWLQIFSIAESSQSTLLNLPIGTLSLQVSPDGQTVMAIDHSGRAEWYSLATQSSIGAIQLEKLGIDDRSVIVQTNDGANVLYVDNSGKRVVRYFHDKPPEPIPAERFADSQRDGEIPQLVIFSPDGIRAALVHSKELRIFDLEKEKDLTRIEISTLNLNTARFSSDGSTLLTVDNDHRVIVWDTTKGKVRGETVLPSTPRISMSRDGRTIAYALDGAAWWWNVEKSKRPICVCDAGNRFSASPFMQWCWYIAAFAGWLAAWRFVSPKHADLSVDHNTYPALPQPPRPLAKLVNVDSGYLLIGCVMSVCCVLLLATCAGDITIGIVLLLVVGLMYLIVRGVWWIFLGFTGFSSSIGLKSEKQIAYASSATHLTPTSLSAHPVTARFFGACELANVFESQFEEALQRFRDVVATPSGATPANHLPPLLLLVFERYVDYATYLEGRWSLPFVFWNGATREIVICEELARQSLREPAEVWRSALAHYFASLTNRDVDKPLWLLLVLEQLLADDLRHAAWSRLQRRLLRETETESLARLSSVSLTAAATRQMIVGLETNTGLERFLDLADSATMVARYVSRNEAARVAFAQVIRGVGRFQSLEKTVQRFFAFDLAELLRRSHELARSETDNVPAPVPTAIAEYVTNEFRITRSDAEIGVLQQARFLRHLGASGYIMAENELSEIAKQGGGPVPTEARRALERMATVPTALREPVGDDTQPRDEVEWFPSPLASNAPPQSLVHAWQWCIFMAVVAVAWSLGIILLGMVESTYVRFCLLLSMACGMYVGSLGASRSTRAIERGPMLLQICILLLNPLPVIGGFLLTSLLSDRAVRMFLKYPTA